MKLIGVHPERKEKWQSYIFYLILFSNITTFYLLIYNLKLTHSKLSEFSSSFASLILLSHGTLKLIFLYNKRPTLLKFLYKTEKLWAVEDIKTDDLRNTLVLTLRYLEYFLTLFYGVVTIAVTCFLLPLIHGVQIFELNDFELRYTATFQVVSFIFGIAIPIVCFDAFYVSLVILIYIQMKIINWRIYVFKNYSENRIKLKIKEWIKHHDRVLR
uniref:Uncharacterized protein LOC114346366 n=1 Tax=Diabrotica virgifera virgifera TaxID=50390 RepID=A0A6P7HAP1_DIAVI